ncbi:APC family permease [Woeseiaceae bacterium]|nr:APC family permease [Woeseiaceae bacterium]
MNNIINETKKKSYLLRAVGAVGIALIALNSTIGSGIFTLPSIVIEQAGAASPWLFLIVGISIITIVLTFGQLASYFKDSGGPVLYTTTAFGPAVGFSTGWILYISRATAFAANSNALALYLGTIWPWFGSGPGRVILITSVCSLLTWINYTGIKDGIKMLVFFTFVKLTPILIVILLGFQYIPIDFVGNATLPPMEGLGPTVLIIIYAFVGFEGATFISGETKNPRSSLPKAMAKTSLFVCLFYFMIMVVYVSVVPENSSNVGALVALGDTLLGQTGIIMMTLAAVFSIGGNLGAIMLAVPRLTLALAEQNLLPKWFGIIHKDYATPGNSILFLGALSLVFALSGSFVYLVIASSLTRLLAYIVSISALPIIKNKADKETEAGAYKLIGGYTIPTMALIICLWITAQSNLDAWILTISLLAFGLILYGIARKALRKNNQT